MKPLLKWAGGKARLVSQIDQAFGQACTGRYFEPFLGSGAVYLHLRAASRVGAAVLSDANPKLVAVHVAVRDDVEGVLRALRQLPREDWRERYYDVREAYNVGPFSGSLHAARFLWLNRAGYNGLYRENLQGRFNVPVGRYASLRLPDPSHFRAVSALLQGTRIVAQPFQATIRQAGEGDHVYCDPPYVPLTATACFTGYCGRRFELSEQRELAEVAQEAARSGARVVLSNHDLPVVRDELYPRALGFEHVARPRLTRAISRGPRRAVHEMIATIGPIAQPRAA